MSIFAANSLWYRQWTFPDNRAVRNRAAKEYTSRLQVRAEADEFFEEADAAWLGWGAWVHIPDQ